MKGWIILCLSTEGTDNICADYEPTGDMKPMQCLESQRKYFKLQNTVEHLWKNLSVTAEET